MMKILVTGNMGYIGTVLVPLLEKESYHVIGYDTNYYQNCKLIDYKQPVKQILKDIRDVSLEDLAGVDAIIHLAALSNDPLGEFAPEITEEINFQATVKLANLAKKAGVERFVYSSSQSMYGISKLHSELDEDNSEKNPLTVYAKTKWKAECELKQLNNEEFTVVCFRPSTVFGASPKLRCDIVFNNLVASAYTTGKIEIKSDGTPCRPVIHVKDVCKAFMAGLIAPKKIISAQSFNIGLKNGNYTVRHLAEAAQEVITGSTLVFTGEHGSDSRTYRVSFKKIHQTLKDYFKPEWDLIKGGKELCNLFEQTGFTEKDFRGSKCIRLEKLNQLVKNHRLSKKLKWL